jgi:hypothetical protein
MTSENSPSSKLFYKYKQKTFILHGAMKKYIQTAGNCLIHPVYLFDFKPAANVNFTLLPVITPDLFVSIKVVISSGNKFFL